MNSKGNNKFGKNLIYVTSFVLITLISLFYKLFLSGSFDGFSSTGIGDTAVTVDTEPSESDEEISPSQTEQTVTFVDVYVCGCVNDPGVYEIERGSILNDAVALAGGLTENAAADRIDLVYIIDSNVSIYIPGEDEESEDNEILRSGDQTIWGDGQGSGSSLTAVPSSRVNINSADRDLLMSLPGIGAVTADAIIEYRSQRSFASIEEIMNVSGIGEAKYNAIKDLICV